MRCRKKYMAWWLLLPLLTGLGIFWGIPSAILVYRSFFTGAGNGQFVGMENYLTVFCSYSFQLACRNTLLFLLISVPVLLAIGFVFAQVINQRISGSRLFQSVLLSPLILPAVGIVTMLEIFFNDSGLINRILAVLGIAKVYWLDSTFDNFPVRAGMLADMLSDTRSHNWDLTWKDHNKYPEKDLSQETIQSFLDAEARITNYILPDDSAVALYNAYLPYCEGIQSLERTQYEVEKEFVYYQDE